MRRIRLTLDYIGTSYAGWQIQPGKDTIEGRVEQALFRLTGEEIKVVASGRTDAGVHALEQVAHFDTGTDFDLRAYTNGINVFLPPDIRVTDARVVPDTFHARFDAKRKTYEYRFYVSKVDRAVLYNRAHRLQSMPDLTALNEAAALFVGEHDFAAFMSSGSDVKTTVRTVYSALFAAQSESEFTFEVSANGFLYNMVRKMVGALIKISENKLTSADISRALADPASTNLPYVAPACGLYLKRVEYEN